MLRVSRLRPLERVFGGIVSILSVLGTLCIVLLALLMIADIIGRELFAAPVAGTPELVGVSMVSIVFLQIGHALYTERLTRNGAFIEKLRTRNRVLGHSLECVFSILGAVAFVMIFLTTIRYFLFAWSSNQYIGGVAGVFIPVWPVKAVILIGSLAMAGQFLVRGWRHLRQALGKGA